MTIRPMLFLQTLAKAARARLAHPTPPAPEAWCRTATLLALRNRFAAQQCVAGWGRTRR
jgi:hypothetical protein